MSRPEDDRDLRDRFEALRREELARVTPLQRIVRRSRPVSSARPLAAAAAAAALVVVAVIVADAWRSREPPVTLAEWKEPTAFLLQTPGRDLLFNVPAFGGIAAVPANSLDASSQERKSIP